MTMERLTEKVLASYLPGLIDNIASRIYSCRQFYFGVWRRGDSYKKNVELEEVLWSDIDRWRERANIERNALAGPALQCRIPRTLTVKNRPPCRGD